MFNLKSILGILLSALCVWWAFKDFQLSSFLSIINEIRLFYLILITCLLWISVWLRSFRWKYLFQSSYGLDVFSLYRAEMVGHFGNNVLPLRLGELMRAFMVSKDRKVSKSYVIGTIILERAIDTISLIIIAVYLIIISPYDLFLIKNISWIIFSLLVVIISMSLISIFIKNVKSEIRFLKHIRELFSGIRSMKFSAVLPVILLSILIWLIYLLNIYFLQYAFNFNLDFIQILMILVFSYLALGVPAAPGMIGTYHAAIKFTIVDLFGLPSAQGNAFALVSHAYGYILLTLIGLYYFMKGQFNIEVISKIIKKNRI